MKVLDILRVAYPGVKCELDAEGPFQLLIATILSAQCTDKRVNMVTPILFAKYPDAYSMSKAPLQDLEGIIRSTGFYQQKAKNILKTAKILDSEFKNEFPKSIDLLTKLPGVGRKTANVVLGNIFNQAAGVVVDTHVKRLAYRMGFTMQTDPEKIELELNSAIPSQHWVETPHLLIHHGRSICDAKKPLCSNCPIEKLCPKKGLGKIKSKKA